MCVYVRLRVCVTSEKINKTAEKETISNCRRGRGTSSLIHAVRSFRLSFLFIIELSKFYHIFEIRHNLKVASPLARIRSFSFLLRTLTYIFLYVVPLYLQLLNVFRTGKEIELYEFILFINTNIVGTRLVHILRRICKCFIYLYILFIYIYIYMFVHTVSRMMFAHKCTHVSVYLRVYVWVAYTLRKLRAE